MTPVLGESLLLTTKNDIWKCKPFFFKHKSISMDSSQCPLSKHVSPRTERTNHQSISSLRRDSETVLEKDRSCHLGMVRWQCTRKQYLAGASWPRRTNLRDRERRNYNITASFIQENCFQVSSVTCTTYLLASSRNIRGAHKNITRKSVPALAKESGKAT